MQRADERTFSRARSAAAAAAAVITD